MNESFKKYFVLKREVCIGESMIRMNIRCSFIQYMPNKRQSRFCTRKFKMCNAMSSFVHLVSLYNGRDFLCGALVVSSTDDGKQQTSVTPISSSCAQTPTSLSPVTALRYNFLQGTRNQIINESCSMRPGWSSWRYVSKSFDL